MKAITDRILIKCENEEQQKHLNNLMRKWYEDEFNRE